LSGLAKAATWSYLPADGFMGHGSFAFVSTSETRFYYSLWDAKPAHEAKRIEQEGQIC